MKANDVDFADPAPALRRDGGSAFRARILSLTSAQAKQLGIGTSTLHYLRAKARDGRPFVVRRKTIISLKSEHEYM